MKKMIFSFLATVVISSFALANTHEIKEIEAYDTIKTLSSTKEITDNELTICYEVARSVRDLSDWVQEVTILWRCVEYPGLGTGTIYLEKNR